MKKRQQLSCWVSGRGPPLPLSKFVSLNRRMPPPPPTPTLVTLAKEHQSAPPPPGPPPVTSVDFNCQSLSGSSTCSASTQFCSSPQTLSSALTPALLSIAASRDIKLCVRPRSDSDIQTDIIKKEEEVVEPLQQKQTQIKLELESKGQPEVPQFVIALVETSASPREYLSRFVHNLQVSTAGTAANISSLIAVPIDLPVGSLAQVQASVQQAFSSSPSSTFCLLPSSSSNSTDDDHDHHQALYFA